MIKSRSKINLRHYTCLLWNLVIRACVVWRSCTVKRKSREKLCEGNDDLEKTLMLWARTTASCRRQGVGEIGTWWARCAKADNSRLKGVYIKPGSQLHGFSLKKARRGETENGLDQNRFDCAKLDADSGSSCKPCNHISISVKRTYRI